MGDITKDDTKNRIYSACGENQVDVILGGPPCQGFSYAGWRDPNDSRNQLFREFVAVVRSIKPKFFVMENVLAILTMRHGDAINEIIECFTDIGYRVSGPLKLNSMWYGVPQKRNRFFILATRFDDWWLSEPNQYRKAVTVSDALVGLPNVVPNTDEEQTTYTGENSDYSKLLQDDKFWRREGLSQSRIVNHKPMRHRVCTLKRFALLQPGDSLKSLFDRYQGEERAKLQAERILPKKMLTQWILIW